MRLKEAKPIIRNNLQEITGLRVEFHGEHHLPSSSNIRHDSFIITLIGKTKSRFSFNVEYKSKASTETIGAAIRFAENSMFAPSLPLIIVPYMGKVGKAMCKQAKVSWMDLSGNAIIHADGLHVNISGHPNQFAERGKPSDLFAPAASRIIHLFFESVFVLNHNKEIVDRTGLSKGYVSKILKRLEEANFLHRDEKGYLILQNREILLEAWTKAYRIGSHQIIKGHIPDKSSQALLERLALNLDQNSIEYAATGLSSAWLYTSYAQYRLNTIYVDSLPEKSLLDSLHFRQVDSGANVWIILPNDPSIFNGIYKINEIYCTSPLQTFLDLSNLPERAAEAMELIRPLIGVEQR